MDETPNQPVALRVAQNVRDLRKERGLHLADLSERLDKLGHPLALNVLSKLENGDRRVDVDDLVALAIALDVTPNRLLLTADGDREGVALTPSGVGGAARTVWRWASGEWHLAVEPDGTPTDYDTGRGARFRKENRPHDPPGTMPFDQVKDHTDVLDPVVDAFRAALAAGVPKGTISTYVDLMEREGES